MKKNKAFTIIELLAVIAMMGVLVAMVVFYQFDMARKQARDSRRIEAARSMVSILSSEEAGRPGQTFVGCAPAGAFVSTSICSGPGDVSQFSVFQDPSASLTPCNDTSDAPCAYSIHSNAGNLLREAKIYFFLEAKGAALGKGLHSVDISGNYDR